jgi:serine/threonine-protein kinase
VDDKTLARYAVENSFITARELNESMGIQEQIDKMGLEPKTLRQILLEKGYLTEKNIEEIASAARGGRKPVTIPGYEFLEKIGKGAMGNVYKARQLSMDRIVAIKVLPKAYSTNEQYIKRFLREARAAAKLNHRNIVLGLDVGESRGLYYYAMEFVDGKTVSRMIKESGPLPEKKALEVALQVARALEHAHQNNFIHRDIKPDNIMLTSEGTAKLCDLGLAKQTDADSSLTMAGTSLGTPYYISPEQAKGARDVDIRTDIYALGGTLFRMATGRLPFEGKNAAAIMARHITDKPAVPSSVKPGLSKSLDRLVLKMLEKNPAKRHQTPKQVIDDIEAVLEGRPVAAKRRAVPVAKPVSAPAAPKQRPRSRREREVETIEVRTGGGKGLLVLVLVAVLVLAGVIAAVYFTGMRSSKPGDDKRFEAIRSTLNSSTGDELAAAVRELRDFIRRTKNAGLRKRAEADLSAAAARELTRVNKKVENFIALNKHDEAKKALNDFAILFSGTSSADDASVRADGIGTGKATRVISAEEQRLRDIQASLIKAGGDWASDVKGLQYLIRVAKDPKVRRSAKSLLTATAFKHKDKVIGEADSLAKAGRAQDAIKALREFAGVFKGTEAAREVSKRAAGLEGEIVRRWNDDRQNARRLADKEDFKGARKILEGVEAYGTPKEKRAADRMISELTEDEADAAAEKDAKMKAKVREVLSNSKELLAEYKFDEVREAVIAALKSPLPASEKKDIQKLAGEIPVLVSVWEHAHKGASNIRGKKFSFLRRKLSGVNGTIKKVTDDIIEVLMSGRSVSVRFDSLKPEVVVSLAKESMGASGKAEKAFAIFILRTGGAPAAAAKHFKRASEFGEDIGEYEHLLAGAECSELLEKAATAEKKRDYLEAASIYSRILKEHGSSKLIDKEEIQKKMEDAIDNSGISNIFMGKVTYTDGKFTITYDFSSEEQRDDFPDYTWRPSRPQPNVWMIEDGALIGEGEDGVIWKGLVKGPVTVEATVRGISPQNPQFRIRVFNTGKGRKSTDYCFGFNAVDYKARVRTTPQHFIARFKNEKYNFLKRQIHRSLIRSGKSTKVKVQVFDETLRMYVGGKLLATIADKKVKRRGYITFQLFKSNVAFEEIKITAALDKAWLKKELRGGR